MRFFLQAFQDLVPKPLTLESLFLIQTGIQGQWETGDALADIPLKSDFKKSKNSLWVERCAAVTECFTELVLTVKCQGTRGTKSTQALTIPLRRTLTCRTAVSLIRSPLLNTCRRQQVLLMSGQMSVITPPQTITSEI